jgi:hypothetical protein
MTALLFIWNTLKACGEILRDSAIARYFTFGVAVAVLISGFFLCRGCKSETDKRIEERGPVIIEQQQGINAASNIAINANAGAVNAANAVNKAQANVNAVQRDRQTNVSIDVANRNRCLAFPDSEGCR